MPLFILMKQKFRLSNLGSLASIMCECLFCWLQEMLGYVAMTKLEHNLS